MIAPFLPMLAARAEPFDSPEFLFEVKWNGVRVLTASADGRWQLWGRDLADYTYRYPELDMLTGLPSGTVLDGELVLLRNGLPDLEAMLARHQLGCPTKIRQRSQAEPVTYVLFDVLCHQGKSLLAEPLFRRRQVLQQLLEQFAEPRLVFSEGIVGFGHAFFEQAVAQGQEGVMAKHLSSPYLPGRRSASWRKIKPARLLPCVIVGFVPGRHGFRRLLVAAPCEGQLRYVATIHSGFTAAVSAQLNELLVTRIRSQPVVRCPERATWVQPELYCQVRFLEWTHAGRLRGASFQRLLTVQEQIHSPSSDGVSSCVLARPSSKAIEAPGRKNLDSGRSHDRE
jgi:DNA ligase D-like protein (predicted ligase)